jgi:hypothetical protein
MGEKAMRLSAARRLPREACHWFVTAGCVAALLLTLPARSPNVGARNEQQQQQPQQPQQQQQLAAGTAYYYSKGCRPRTDEGFLAPRFFPIPQFRMTLGDASNPCRHLRDCDAFAKGHLEWPEAFVVQVLIATLGECPYGLAPCYVADFGGNLGYVNSYAAAMGAHVVSIEPQHDLWEANRQTIVNNCWAHRVHTLEGYVTLNETEDGDSATVSRLWRPGMVDFTKPREVKKVWIGNILAKNPTGAFRLVKIDVDSIDDLILHWILDKVAMGTMSVDSFVIESTGPGAVMHKASMLGYQIFQLDHHMRVRFFDHKGADVFRLRGCPAPVADYREEYFCRRGIQYMMRVVPPPEPQTPEAWDRRIKSILASRGPGWESLATSWLITRETLSQPSVMESWSATRPSPLRGVYVNSNFGLPGEPVNPNPLDPLNLTWGGMS